MSVLPFVHKFTSMAGNQYVYDANTQEIAKVSKVLFDIIDDPHLFRTEALRAKWSPRHSISDIDLAVAEILRARKQGLFLPSLARSMVPPACDDCIEEMLRTKSGKLLINITHDCNLRCVYCTYSGLYEGHRSHERRTMDIQCGESAIDLLMRRMPESPEHHVSFYGGEPTLEFDLVAHIIKYARDRYPDNKFSFHITTNGTLWSNDMLRYCIENNISLQISLDGPEEIHDRYRRDKHGTGSHARIHEMLRRIGLLNRRYYDNNLSFSATLAPPYDLESIDAFFEAEHMPHTFLAVSLVDPYDTIFYELYTTEAEEARFFSRRRVLMRDYVEDRVANRTPSSFKRALFERPLIDLHVRKRRQQPNSIQCNGVCVPFVRRMFVDVDGRVFPCERVGSAFAGGNVRDGLDKDRITEIISYYISSAKDDCLKCWAARLCRLCLSSSAVNGQFSIERKKQHCPSEKVRVAETLVIYASILERNGRAFDFIDTMVFD